MATRKPRANFCDTSSITVKKCENPKEYFKQYDQLPERKRANAKRSYELFGNNIVCKCGKRTSKMHFSEHQKSDGYHIKFCLNNMGSTIESVLKIKSLLDQQNEQIQKLLS